MGFIRQQQEQLAARFLRWQYQKARLPVPPPVELERRAVKLLDDALRIGRERGGNVISILKELARDIKNKESS
ncbi:MAG: hypothetical protein Q8P24_11215 [Desulfobacterales bacterium]|nr:hypothetical protein [Desulfobacterales bacterium]